MTDVETKLLQIAACVANQSEAELLSDVQSGDLTPRSRMYEWREHIPEEIRPLWHAITLESKLALWIAADLAAHVEVSNQLSRDTD